MDSEPSSEDSLGPVRTRRRWLVPAIVGGVLVIIGGVIVGSAVSYRREHEQARNAAWSRVAQCFLGGEPTSGERPSLRFRAIERSTAFHKSQGDRDWPYDCNSELDAFWKTLKHYDEVHEGQLDVAYWAVTLQKRTKTERLEYALAIDNLFDEAKKGSFSFSPRTDVPSPPQPVQAWTYDDVERAGELTHHAKLEQIASDLVPGRTLRLLVPEPIDNRMCIFDGNATFKCAAHRYAVTEQRRPFIYGTADDDGPALVANAVDAFTEDGRELKAHNVYRGGYMRRDGVSYQLLHIENDDNSDFAMLRRFKADGTATDAKVTLEGNFHVEMFRDWIVFHDRVAGLWAHKVLLDDKAPALGPRISIGNGNYADARLHACMRADGLAVLESSDKGNLLFFLNGSTWTSPKPVLSGSLQLACDDQGASVMNDRTVVNCAAATGECTVVEQADVSIEAQGDGLQAAAIDAVGTVVSVSHASDAFEIQVARGKTIISRTVLDGVVKGGMLLKAPLLSSMTLFARPGFAVVAIAITGGVTRVLRVGADGKVAPVTVVRT